MFITQTVGLFLQSCLLFCFHGYISPAPIVKRSSDVISKDSHPGSDIFLILDAGIYQGEDHQAKVDIGISFLTKLSSLVQLGPQAYRIGIVTGESDTYQQVPLNRTYDALTLVKEAEKLSYDSPVVDISKTLYEVRTRLLNDHGTRNGFPKIGLLITSGHGRIDEATLNAETTRYQKKGIKLFVLAIGNLADPVLYKQLKLVASKPTNSYLYGILDLNSIIDDRSVQFIVSFLKEATYNYWQTHGINITNTPQLVNCSIPEISDIPETQMDKYHVNCTMVTIIENAMTGKYNPVLVPANCIATVTWFEDNVLNNIYRIVNSSLNCSIQLPPELNIIQNGELKLSSPKNCTWNYMKPRYTYKVNASCNLMLQVTTPEPCHDCITKTSVTQNPGYTDTIQIPTDPELHTPYPLNCSLNYSDLTITQTRTINCSWIKPRDSMNQTMADIPLQCLTTVSHFGYINTRSLYNVTFECTGNSMVNLTGETKFKINCTYSTSGFNFSSICYWLVLGDIDVSPTSSVYPATTQAQANASLPLNCTMVGNPVSKNLVIGNLGINATINCTLPTTSTVTSSAMQTTASTPKRQVSTTVTTKIPISTAKSYIETPDLTESISTNKPPLTTVITTKIPVSTTSTTKRPVSTTSTTKRPVSTTSTTKRPVSTTTTTKRPVSKTTTTKRPVSTLTATKRPVSTTTTTKRPVSTTTTTKRPVSTTTTTKRPVSTTPTTKRQFSTTETAAKQASTRITSARPVSTRPATTKRLVLTTAATTTGRQVSTTEIDDSREIGEIRVTDDRGSTGPRRTTNSPSDEDKTVWSCEFEGRDLCGMAVIEDSDNFDWIVWDRPVPSEETGPQSAFSGMFYIYTEATDRNTGDVAVIVLPSLEVNSGPYCLDFHYHMYGYHMGTLDVLVNEEVVWTKSGNQEDQWHQAQVNLNLQPGYVVWFSAVRGDGFSNDFSLDSIQLSEGSCSGGTTLVVPTGVKSQTDKISTAKSIVTRTTTTGKPTTLTRPTTESLKATTKVTQKPTEMRSSLESTTLTSSSKITDPIWQCEFELNDICGGSVLPDGDSYDWLVWRGSVPSLETGPSQGYSGDYYMYTEATGKNTGDVSVLAFPPVEVTGPHCLDFHYHMYGHHMGTLQVLVGEQTVWSLSRDQGNQWHHAQATLNLQTFSKIEFHATRGDGFSSDIAMDYLRLYTGPCDEVTEDGFSTLATSKPDPVSTRKSTTIKQAISTTSESTEKPTTEKPTTEQIKTTEKTTIKEETISTIPATSGTYYPDGDPIWQCEFDLNDICGASVLPDGDSYDWLVWRGSVPSLETGPSQGYSGDYYMYTEATGKNTGDVSVLAFPPVDVSGPHCLDFHYHMYGHHMGTLQVLVGEQTVWSLSRDQGNQWHHAQATLNLQTFSKIEFHATRGDGFSSDIAVDYLRLYTGPCDEVTEDGFSTSKPDPVSTRKSTTIKQTISTTSESTEKPTTEKPTTEQIKTTEKTTIKEEKISTIPATSDSDPIWQCEFDLNDICGASVLPDGDSYDWLVWRGSVPSLETGPSQGYSGDYYMYTEATGKNTGDVSVLAFPPVEVSGLHCLDFHYHMYGHHMGTLQVLVGEQAVWSLSRDQGNQWHHAQATLDLQASSKIEFHARRGDGFSSDMAVDHLRLYVGECGQGITRMPETDINTATQTTKTAPTTVLKATTTKIKATTVNIIAETTVKTTSTTTKDARTTQIEYTAPAFSWSCGFDDDLDPLCGMSQSEEDVFDWTRISGGTPSEPTGPSHAHSGSYYLYLESSDWKAFDDDAVLYLPTSGLTGRYCVTFMYHMFGVHIHQLRVTQDSHTSPLWLEEGDQGDRWLQAKVKVTLNSKADKVGIRGSVNGFYTGDIAIDSISFTSDLRVCGDAHGTTEPMTSTSTQISSTSVPTTKSTEKSSTNQPSIRVTTTLPAETSARPSGHDLVWSCGLEDDTLCEMTQAEDDRFDWTRRSGPTPSSGTGPDSADSGNFYMFLEASGKDKDDYAILYLPILSMAGDFCLTFKYHMYGFHIHQLQVIQSSHGQDPLWMKAGQINQTWLEADVLVSLRQQDDLIGFKGSVDGEYSGDIGLDTITLTSDVTACGVHRNTQETFTSQKTKIPSTSPSTTLSTRTNTTTILPTEPVQWSCDFEDLGSNDPWCGIEQMENDVFDWTLTNQRTPSDDTGPNLAQNGSQYIFIETSNPRTLNQTASILLPPMRASGLLCVTFYYHMYGLHINQLQLYSHSDGEQDKLLWSAQGNKGNIWLEQKMFVQLAESDQLGFTGLSGQEYAADIALDNMSLISGVNVCESSL